MSVRPKVLLAAAAALGAGLIAYVALQEEPVPSTPAQVGALPPAPAEATHPATDVVAPAAEALRDERARAVEPKLDGELASPDRLQAVVVVTNLADLPVEGARVRVRDSVDDFDDERLTDASGRCTIWVDPDRRVEVHVDADGYQHSTSHWTGAAKITAHLRPVSAMKGRVLSLETGAPIAGANVRLQFKDCGICEAPEAECDGVGTFQLDGIPLDSRSRVFASADGYLTGERTFVLQERDAELEIFLDRGVELWVDVSDLETGAAVQNAVVGRGLHTLEVPPSGRLRTAELIGREEEEETVRLFVQAKGYCRLDFRIDPRTQQPGELVRLRLPRGVTIDGTVLDPSGQRPPGVSVRAREDATSRTARFSGSPAERRGELESLPAGWRYSLPRDSWERPVDDEGDFRIEGVVPWTGNLHIWVMADDHEEFEDLLEVGAPGSSQSLDVVLQPLLHGPSGTVRGRLTLNGRGIAGSLVWRGAATEGWVQADADGAFSAERVEAGAVRFEPQPDGFRLWREECVELLIGDDEWIANVTDGAVVELNVDLVAETAPIRGRVLGSGGEPVAGVHVTARASNGCTRHSASTGSDGTFEFDVDAHSPSYELRANVGPDGIALENVAPGTEDVELRISDLAVLRYRVVDVDTGRPLFQSRLLWRRPGEAKYRTYGGRDATVANPEGWHEVEFAQGVYDVGASMARSAPEYLPHFIDGFRLDAETRTVVFEVERGLEVDLVLGGQRIKGKKNLRKRSWPNDVTVLLLDLDYLDDVTYKGKKESWSWGPGLVGINPLATWKVTFDKLGTAKLGALRPGRHRFRSFPSGLTFRPAEIDVHPGMEPIVLEWFQKN